MSRLDLAYFEPRETPPEIKSYSSPIRQLAVGSPGKLGGLKLALSKDPSGRTVIKDLWKQVPLQTLRPFYYDENKPEMAIIYILNPTGGTLQGDRLRIDVSLEAGTKVHLTTQAATKLYGMNADYATQVINLNLGRDSYLEYLPDQTIPYRNSRFYQEVSVRMHNNSSLVYWEILTPGRKGREHFDYDIYYSRLNVQDESGNPLLSDTVVLQPKSSSLTRQGAMGKHEVLGNFYVVSESVDGKLIEKIHSAAQDKEVMAGAGPTSMTHGVVARVLGPSSRVVRTTLEKIWNEARIRVLGSPAPRIRK